jgi:hypothetical protein
VGTSGGFKSKVEIGTSGTVSKEAVLAAVDPVFIPPNQEEG